MKNINKLLYICNTIAYKNRVYRTYYGGQIHYITHSRNLINLFFEEDYIYNKILETYEIEIEYDE
jgi:hypothetical protein